MAFNINAVAGGGGVFILYLFAFCVFYDPLYVYVVWFLRFLFLFSFYYCKAL